MKKIYLIDDDQFYLKLLSKRLSNLGYTVKTFFSVEEALPNLKETPDVIVLDHNFGYSELKGQDYIPLLKMHAKSSALLYVTSESSPSIINGTLTAGADMYLRKDGEVYNKISSAIANLLAKQHKGFWTDLLD